MEEGDRHKGWPKKASNKMRIDWFADYIQRWQRCDTAAGEGDPDQGWPKKASTAAQHLRDVFYRMGLNVSSTSPSRSEYRYHRIARAWCCSTNGHPAATTCRACCKLPGPQAHMAAAVLSTSSRK